MYIVHMNGQLNKNTIKPVQKIRPKYKYFFKNNKFTNK